LNVVDVTDLCTWIAPAIVRRGDVSVAVSTGGASPALARRFREQLSGTNRLPTRRGVMELADLAPLLSDARADLAGRGQRVKVDHWQACLTDELVDLVQTGRRTQADVLLRALLHAAAAGVADGPASAST
jgi:siroheme synthase-like protein